jgi:hypothetical protein
MIRIQEENTGHRLVLYGDPGNQVWIEIPLYRNPETGELQEQPPEPSAEAMPAPIAS